LEDLVKNLDVSWTSQLKRQRLERSWLEASWAKVSKTLSQQTSWVWWFMPIIPGVSRRIVV
jgi:hypothetical protein